MNLPGYIQGRNEHNYKNKICTKKEISELDWILMCPIPFFFFFGDISLDEIYGTRLD